MLFIMSNTSLSLRNFKSIHFFYESIKGLNGKTVAVATIVVDNLNDHLLRYGQLVKPKSSKLKII